MSSLGRQTFLVVFDFDHTVVNCNTDEVIPAVLGRSKDQMRMRADGLQWTKAMDTLVAPFSREELVAAAAKSVVIDPEMPQLFRYLRKLQLEHPAITGGQADQHQRFVEVNIASDSNLLFIDASLQALLPFAIPGIHQIHSNPYNEVSAERPTDGLRARCGPNDQEEHVVNCCGVDEAERDAKYNAAWPNFQRRSRVSWYDPVGHTCGCCQAKPNMCKTHIIQRLLSTTHLIDPTIIFVGDGANDYCPILQLLRPRDYMFARRGFPAHQLISATGPEGAAGGCCHIGLWEDAKELLSLFRGAIEHPQGRLPTLARFRDVGSEEFRAQTLSRRLAAIAERTLAENRSIISNLARERVESLMNDVRSNAVVAPLPGQRAVPAWLRNFSAVEQYDGQKAGATSMEQRPAPRWGQLPWLHGEIYFFHLFWQRMMLVDGAEAAIAATSTTTGVKQDELVVNLITPNAIINPVFTQKSGLTATPGLVSPAVMTHQDFCPDLIVRKSLSIQDSVTARIHVAGGGPDEVKEVPYASLVDPVGQGLLPTHGVFANYADVFAKEKRDVLVNFLSARVLPMLQCEPWSAPVNFAPVLLRWMLWGNGLDLSIFTMEELMAKHSAGEESAGEHDKMVELARERERKSTASQDAQLVGNEADGVAQYLMQLVRQHQSGSGSQPACCHPAAAATNHLDIVMDNVGVESISDLCLGLWFIHTSRAAADTPILPTVAFHVKCMPYYVSDVTPPDFEILLTELIEASLANVAMKAAFMPFVERVREAFEQGHFTVDADTVWTQPSEYRELPPRVINRYFYTQTVAPATCTTAPANIAETLPTARDLYVANKAAFTPRSALVIFKGDLNYRRLMGDRYWNRSDFQASLATPAKSGAAVDLRNASTHYTPQQKAMMDALLCSTPAEAVMEGPTFTELVSAFWPIHVLPVCSIRTIKSECCIGVPAATKAALDDQHGLQWRTNGKLGEILFAHV